MLDVIHLTKELIAIESTDPGTMEGGVAAYIRSYLSGCGAEITLQDVQPGRQNLMARLGGDLAGPALVLCCHMDTVVFGDGWTRDPLGAEEAEGRIYGRGSCDMKSGLACALSAFRKTALAVQAGAKLKRPLALLCTVDEEADMAGIGQAIECGLVRKDDWVMDLEPTGGQIQMAHKGRLWLEIDVQGVTAHASRPEQGADAIAAAGELIARARRDFLTRAGDGDPVLGRATITFGQITGGYQPYVVPDRCRLWVDMRLAPPIDSGTAQAIFREAAAQAEAAVPGVNVSIRSHRRPALYPPPPGRPSAPRPPKRLSSRHGQRAGGGPLPRLHRHRRRRRDPGERQLPLLRPREPGAGPQTRRICGDRGPSPL